MQSMRPGQATSNSQDITTRTSQSSVPANSDSTLGIENSGGELVLERITDSELPHRHLEPSASSVHSSSSPTQTHPNSDECSSAHQSAINPVARGGGTRNALQRDNEFREAPAETSWSAASTNTLRQSRTEHGLLTINNNLRSVVADGTWIDKSRSLPADDGMRSFRQRIHAIRESRASNTEKARQIHSIMTEDYRSTLKVPDGSHPGLQRRVTTQSTERPQTPLSPRSKRSSDQFTLTPASTSSSVCSASDGPYYLTMDDLSPTYAPDVGTPTQNHNYGDPFFSNQASETAPQLDGGQQRDLGCQHYKRNVKLQCYTCKKWYTCRFCHDDADDHTLIRHKTENMLCMVCQTPQRAAQWCRACGTQAAHYYCGICKLWDNDGSKSIYHCHDCGICRRGEGLGKDFFHCKKCCVCLPIKMETSHRCIERVTKCDCPICGEYMFTSTHPVIFMKCGHSIHQRCFNKYSQGSYRCPICNKTVTKMEAHFRNLDHMISSQPMPAEFKNTKAVINCNDCRAKSVVRYHWLGLKCDVCDSYNTSQIRLFSAEGSQPEEPDSGRDRGIPIAAPRELGDPFVENRTMARSIPGTDGALDVPGSSRETGTGQPSTFPHNYNARSVSPTVSNYFGLSRRRGSIWTTISHPEVIHSEGEREEEEHGGSWAVSALRRATLGLLGNRGNQSEHESGEEDNHANDLDDEFEDVLEEVEEYEEVDDLIDIFGHR